jgi:hypothetical protein
VTFTTEPLESAYRTLLDMLRTASFRSPADAADWDAELVLAHLAANDRLLAATTAALLADDAPAYDNAAATREVGLHALARAAGDWNGLVATVRQSGLELVLLARQLDSVTAATAVPTRIIDGDVVRVDAAVPWSGVLNTHAEVHLPSHISQLRALAR